MSHKRWIVADVNKEKASAFSEKFDIDPFVSYLLVARGISSESQVVEYLSSAYTLSSPMGFADMDKAIECISNALDEGHRICVYGDYDCDGVTSTALLLSFFESMGADAFCYIPDRNNEGYGMNKNAVKTISEKGAKLIITVDNGISSIEEADYIYELGMELVITDHHQLPDVLPRAQAIINPHREDNNIPFKDFCGVGVVFKLVCALMDDTDTPLEMFADLVAIGTIADVVPLKGENRALVRAGLKLINKGERIGLKALQQIAGGNEYTASDVAFRICPRINAAGRLSSAMSALELILCDDDERANTLAQALCDENSHRQEIEKNILSDINLQIDSDPSITANRVIVIAGKGYHTGVIGIDASRLVDTYGKPAIVISINEDGTACGSARSVDGFNIYEAIEYCSDTLTRFGGHPLAAGIGLSDDKIDDFRNLINEYAQNNYESMPHQYLQIDCKLSPRYLSLDLVEALGAMEPCGADNSNAIFGLYGLTLISVSPMGECRHIRLEATKGNSKVRIVKFGVSPDAFAFVPGDIIDCAVKISRNNYQGKSYLSVQAVDIRRNGCDDDLYFSSLQDLDNISLGKKPKGEFYPQREECSQVYRFLRQHKDFNGNEDDIYFGLSQKVTLCQIHFAIKAFCEAGLVDNTEGIKLLEASGKKDLQNTDVLVSLKERFL